MHGEGRGVQRSPVAQEQREWGSSREQAQRGTRRKGGEVRGRHGEHAGGRGQQECWGSLVQ